MIKTQPATSTVTCDECGKNIEKQFVYVTSRLISHAYESEFAMAYHSLPVPTVPIIPKQLDFCSISCAVVHLNNLLRK